MSTAAFQNPDALMRAEKFAPGTGVGGEGSPPDGSQGECGCFLWFDSTCWVMALDRLLGTNARLQRPPWPQVAWGEAERLGLHTASLQPFLPFLPLHCCPSLEGSAPDPHVDNPTLSPWIRDKAETTPQRRNLRHQQEMREAKPGGKEAGLGAGPENRI